ncbi:DUF3696 domain-containing protein [Undibacterium sp. 14-3-2]|uniref:DUF3696 domain-containing protein n=1 Tax=Undibacterium sp. 14-3-2 TaxID=2800129 RepID=UPI00190320E4|nr:DUF3696 domain-containing protein [Undibacterium sp. 14-3-2]MBK1888601.1 DUF3696 domain-containing protein [Undibacterium sp. 14-3-2]
MLNSIKLENFKCYRDLEIGFSSLTIFCGNNSVGKSTAIQALAVPFQSKFQDYVHLNGELVNLGSYKDIHSTDAVNEGDEHMAVVLDFSVDAVAVQFGYGFASVDDQTLLGNKLQSNVEQRAQATLGEWYFSQVGFQFLEAERFGPRNSFRLNENNDIIDWVGPRGEYTIEVIYKLLNNDRRVFPKDALDARMHPDSENYNILKNIEFWMSEISPGFSVSPILVEGARISHATFSTRNSTLQTKPINMGFGLSYALGIVTALLVTKPKGLVVIENPEAHLHPRGQSYLGRLIALSALAGVQVIVETHSDHLLNGIRVIARLRNEYIDGQFKVCFVSASDGKADLTEISIGKKGELSSWPSGFFDQQAQDIRSIMKGEEVRNI